MKAYWPRSRGFDTFFGILGGQVKYWEHVVAEERVSDYFRNEDPIYQNSYSGSDFTNEGRLGNLLRYLVNYSKFMIYFYQRTGVRFFLAKVSG